MLPGRWAPRLDLESPHTPASPSAPLLKPGPPAPVPPDSLLPKAAGSACGLCLPLLPAPGHESRSLALSSSPLSVIPSASQWSLCLSSHCSENPRFALPSQAQAWCPPLFAERSLEGVSALTTPGPLLPPSSPPTLPISTGTVQCLLETPGPPVSHSVPSLLPLLLLPSKSGFVALLSSPPSLLCPSHGCERCPKVDPKCTAQQGLPWKLPLYLPHGPCCVLLGLTDTSGFAPRKEVRIF